MRAPVGAKNSVIIANAVTCNSLGQPLESYSQWNQSFDRPFECLMHCIVGYLSTTPVSKWCLLPIGNIAAKLIWLSMLLSFESLLIGQQEAVPVTAGTIHLISTFSTK